MERLRYSVKLRSDRRETMVERSFEDLSLCYTGVCMAEIENIWIGFRLEAKATSPQRIEKGVLQCLIRRLFKRTPLISFPSVQMLKHSDGLY